MHELPVRTCETVTGSGTRKRALRVFCPLRAKTFDLGECARCPRMRSLPADPESPGARIACEFEIEGSAAGPSTVSTSFTTLASGVHVGAAMAGGVTCVRQELALAEAVAHVRGFLVPVVDEGGALVGVFYRPDLLPVPVRNDLEIPPRVAPSTVTVGDRMDPHPRVLFESSPLVEALDAMTVHRARSLPVLAEHRVVVGVLTDLDLLGWFGRARRHVRP
jgi:CBS domain